MTVYVDYAFYTGTFLGTAIVSADFNALALRASAVIDQITFGRAAVDYAANENVTAIKNATCAIAEELQRQAAAGYTDSVQSESQGRYSVSFFAHGNKAKSNMGKLLDAARVWLANTDLMFAGFADGEYSSDSQL